ncbi:CGNR zinc finger domain-containing protein [Modestobacter versicolor]|uniref:Putative RNA-binding Zn ribbon-like protein n=1 Tax=Modestobacter versicolor TaxID=429133 RepID=A0A323V565_9ACTN|nr:CGNR zinc finger domain-containing protein [Modestobacter versicolor]MBB3676860.1 putative RNA-binding Zn ribbon-like protein [Modestobacter versicolor]PZA20005.1 RNA-binding protein [Modestobacter versicolor]
MLFAHDTEIALAGAAALLNTASDGEERLPDPAALSAFLDAWQFTGSRVGDAAELAAVHELRAVLAAIWGAEEDAVVAVVNRLLRDGSALPQLVRHDGWGYHVHATEPSAPVADRWGVEAAMALADVVRAGALDRLRRCAASGCDDALVDLTKNASRRFCDSSCANREHVAAYRARRAAG